MGTPSSTAAAVRLITATLATFRLTRLVVDDQITEPLRRRVWRRYPPEDHGPGFVLTCPHCASIYTAAAIATLSLVAAAPRTPAPVRIAADLLTTLLALSGTISLLNDYGPPTNSSGWSH